MKMEPDFIKIQDERVGYRIRANIIDGPRWLEALTFRQFIPPYVHRTENADQVYQNLEQALTSAIKQQESVINKERSVMIDVLATATLQREAIRNSMDLIKKHYL